MQRRNVPAVKCGKRSALIQRNIFLGVWDQTEQPVCFKVSYFISQTETVAISTAQGWPPHKFGRIFSSIGKLTEIVIKIKSIFSIILSSPFIVDYNYFKPVEKCA